MEEESSKILILVGSPRRNGNSAALAEAVRQGCQESGAVPSVRFIDDYVSSFLRDCRICRKSDGECSIADGFRELFFEEFLPARGVVFCTPVYWYGVSGQTKTFFDRTFCYYAASYPNSDDVIGAMSGKRIGLVVSSEETYPGASLGIIHQIQEYSRYTHSEFAGVVRGVGNKRSEVDLDPSRPLEEAMGLGRNLLNSHYSDFRIDTPRQGNVWNRPVGNPAEQKSDD